MYNGYVQLSWHLHIILYGWLMIFALMAEVFSIILALERAKWKIGLENFVPRRVSLAISHFSLIDYVSTPSYGFLSNIPTSSCKWGLGPGRAELHDVSWIKHKHFRNTIRRLKDNSMEDIAFQMKSQTHNHEWHIFIHIYMAEMERKARSNTWTQVETQCRTIKNSN